MSLGQRAVMAAVLTVAFYGLALLIAAVLLLVPFAEVVWLGRLTITLALACVVCAGLVIWSIFPRSAPFNAPGPVLDPARNRRLFAELHGVARQVGEPMPAEVYLVPDVNAAVSERGGRLGLGGSRVMVVGLPLLQVLCVSELRAVLAHEFGHYYGGDARLAAWVYRTRVAVGRTQDLSRYRDLLHLPFSLYRKLFMRVTNSISRRQEFAADALAARTVGARAMIGALSAVEHATPAFDAYWRSEMVPVLEAGFRPPLAGGFLSFIHQESVKAAVDEAVRPRLVDAVGDPDGSHPPFAQRVAALRAFPPGADYGSEPAAITLLDGVPELESALVARLLRPGKQAPQPIAWEDVGTRVIVPAWKRRVSDTGHVLQGVALTSFPQLVSNAEQLGRSLARAHGADSYLSRDNAKKIGTSSLEAALGLTLIRHGWSVESLPGTPVSLRRNGAAIDCHDVIERIAVGELDDVAWQRWCRAPGIEDATVGAAEYSGVGAGALRA
jgi:Zn-dependent protease with chaperone function